MTSPHCVVLVKHSKLPAAVVLTGPITEIPGTIIPPGILICGVVAIGSPPSLMQWNGILSPKKAQICVNGGGGLLSRAQPL